MCAEATLGEFAISLVLVISCEPVKVESASRNFNQPRLRIYIHIGTSPFSLMGNQTVHEDSNNATCFKYKYKLSLIVWLLKPKLIHVRIENRRYGSSFILTSIGTDGSQNYVEHCHIC